MTGSLISQDFAERIRLLERLEALDAHGANRPDNPLGEAIATFEHPYLTVGLERYHRVAARHGVSPRHPFADRRLVELAVHLPDRERHADGWSKAILRRIMTNRLPPEVRLREDKQHLGWKFTCTVRAQDLGRARRLLNEQRELLAPYLDWHRLEAALDRGDGDSLEAVLTATALAAWLGRGGKR
jgi:asparagine synthase (glutamine-hydrolysing)